MLAGACVLLEHRMRNNRLRATTAELAALRKTLMRLEPRPAQTLRGLSRPLVGRTRVSLLGLARQINWVERPEKPYGEMRLAPWNHLVRLPYKSFKRHGVSPGAVVIVTGKVKDDCEAGLLLEVEQEGPTTHAATVWEDWLATELRPQYDLHPASLRAAWELPAFGAPSGRLDLLTRVLKEVQS